MSHTPVTMQHVTCHHSHHPQFNHAYAVTSASPRQRSVDFPVPVRKVLTEINALNHYRITIAFFIIYLTQLYLWNWTDKIHYTSFPVLFKVNTMTAPDRTWPSDSRKMSCQWSVVITNVAKCIGPGNLQILEIFVCDSWLCTAMFRHWFSLPNSFVLLGNIFSPSSPSSDLLSALLTLGWVVWFCW